MPNQMTGSKLALKTGSSRKITARLIPRLLLEGAKRMSRRRSQKVKSEILTPSLSWSADCAKH